MANQVVTLYQGDTSATFVVTIKDESGDYLTSLSGYTGHFSVVDEIGDTTTFASKAMTESTTTPSDSEVAVPCFISSILPAESELMTTGAYWAVCEIENTSISFRKEDHTQVIIEPQGYEA